MDSTKKISFGFTKLVKKPNVILNKPNEKKPENNIQMISCLEESSIKLVNESTKSEAPLMIPVQQNRTSAALASLKLRQEILSGNLDGEKVDKSEDSNKTNSISKDEAQVVDENESLDKKAAKELLDEVRNKTIIEKLDTSIQVPLKPDELPLEGAEEPSAEDYDKIPISQFGLAMLRGMGWKDEQKKSDKFDSDQPILRPKGMGLGADKVLKAKPLLVAPEKNEKLEIKKGACVRILGGKHKDLYAQIEGLDDHAGRVIVKLAIGGNKESLNEFLVQPVSKGEYTKYGKVINSAKYEEYKKKQEDAQKEQQSDIKYEKFKKENNVEIKNETRSIKKEIKKEGNNSDDSIKQEERVNSSRYYKDDYYRDSSRHRSREDKESSTRRHERHSNYSEEEDSISTEDSQDYHHRSKKRSSKSKKNKSRRDRSSHHCSDSENDKRHKKKTKKSKKARSRSRGRR